MIMRFYKSGEGVVIYFHFDTHLEICFMFNELRFCQEYPCDFGGYYNLMGG